MEHQNSFGCRECSNGNNLLLVTGEAHDAPVGRQLLLELGPMPVEVPLVMDRAYESDETLTTGAGIEHDPSGSTQIVSP